MHATTSAAQWREAVCTVLQWSRVERRGHIPVLQLLLRPTAGSSQPFQEDPHDCDDEEEGEKGQRYEDGDGNGQHGVKDGLGMCPLVLTSV